MTNCDELIVIGIQHAINLFRKAVQFNFDNITVNKIEIILATASSLDNLGTITSETESLKALSFPRWVSCSLVGTEPQTQI